MVHKEEAHDFAGFGNLLGKYIIGFAWLRIVAGMIVAEGDNSSVVEHRFFYDEPDVGCRFCNAAFEMQLALMSLKFWFIIRSHASSVAKSCIFGSI